MSSSRAALFVDDKISQAVVPKDYSIRPLKQDDHERGFLTILDALVSTQLPLSREIFTAPFQELQQANQVWLNTLVLVILDRDDQIAATVTLLVEHKFLRAGAIAGHIVDIAVRPDQQGRGFGRILVEALTKLAERQGCYKVILDCDEKNFAFYEKCTYERAGIEMKNYF
ncbi:acyl-CoA N-acyltransferase [Protomyces lactucae-debilis]|uniref:Glucosamine 6-phosphate N-acetyltransferase n=1 Tax=Protomyces lactucae-debilis TaxID=2754530 RepID=A0A1Y2EY71_PROLT|nr:acyl-CoA N-acyltransferase [Protomyces lactucae-debilis]ORY75745.1 acyl-CoA N-acyltransferase [Protomyces lactucae-debilis]